ncbi:MAG TPA: TerC/Alx family metal homeostasis membrane protein [Gemmatimonadales bacterium]|nr:TerC/Alx family metal homeostasis membrane protein [Gemmatimonadales bacterium]
MSFDLGHHPPVVWGAFTLVVVVLLVLDLFVVNRKSHVLTLAEAGRWFGALVALALLFGLFLLGREGSKAMLEYYTGYLIELSLSVDNLFVFILVFQYFAVPAALQPKVLKWGILGALVLRAVMILGGALLLQRFSWITWVFGGILVFTGWKMLTRTEERIEPGRNPVVRLVRRILPVGDAFEGDRFVVRGHRGWRLTPLLLVLLTIEWTDLVFAIDSIPAVFAVTRDPFIVYSSNVFAILGLRALFFLVAGLLDTFRHLKSGVAIVLLFVGLKMAATPFLHIPIGLSLGVIVGVLAGAVALSLRHPAPARE